MADMQHQSPTRRKHIAISKASTDFAPTYMPAIDGLRAIAVLSVMLFHIDANLIPGGFAGVDLFFVISGFVVTRSVLVEKHETFGQFIKAFYVRRMRRILPALYFMLIASSLLVIMFIPKSWLSGSTDLTARAAYYGASNFVLVQKDDAYFDPRTEYNPFVHTWSLGVEEQFYLLFPLILWWSLRTVPLGGLRAKIAQSAIPVLALLSLCVAALQTRQSPDASFYLLPSRFWELACGAVLALYHFQHPRGSGNFQLRFVQTEAAALLGAILVLVSLAFVDREAFPFPWALPIVLGSVLLLHSIAGTRGSLGSTRLLEWPFIVHIGRISYPLYLWHWPIFALFRWTSGLETIHERIIAIGLTVLMAEGSARFIEAPFRYGDWVRRMPEIRQFKFGLTSIAVFSLIGVGIFELRGPLSQSRVSVDAGWYPYAEIKPPARTSGLPLSGRTLFAVGDSHIKAYLPLLAQVTRDTGATVVPVVVIGCNLFRLTKTDPSGSSCKSQTDAAIGQVLVEAKPGDIVFLASLRVPRFNDHFVDHGFEDVVEKFLSAEAASRRAAALEDARKAISELTAKGLFVIFEAPKPILRAPPYRCSDWFNRDNPICSHGIDVDRALLERLREPILASEQTLAKQFHNVSVWDPFPILCPHDVCRGFDAEGAPLYFDGDHISKHSNDLLYPSFRLALLHAVDAG